MKKIKPKVKDKKVDCLCSDSQSSTYYTRNGCLAPVEIVFVEICKNCRTPEYEKIIAKQKAKEKKQEIINDKCEVIPDPSNKEKERKIYSGGEAELWIWRGTVHKEKKDSFIKRLMKWRMPM